MSDIQILILDDEKEITILLDRYLTKKGFYVETANEFTEAKQKLKQLSFDLVISDLKMPQVNGIEFSQYLNKNYPHIPVIILTGHGTLETAIEALKLPNVFDYLLKPVDQLTELLYRINKTVEYNQIKLENQQLLTNFKNLNQQLTSKVDEQTKELKKAYDELKATEKLKSELLANVSHELRSPITPIEGYISMFLDGEFGELPEEHADIIKQMQYCLQRLKKQVDNILYLTMYEAENLLLSIDTFHFNDMLHNLNHIFEFQIQSKSQYFDFDLKANQATVVGDLQQISRLMNIFIDNAIKFGYEKTPILIKTNNLTGEMIQNRISHPFKNYQILKSYIAEDIQPDDLFLEIVIQDKGKGISPEKLPHVFNTFYQADGSMTRDADGIGLGLAIAIKILKSHQSMLYLESHLNVGTTISFIMSCN